MPLPALGALGAVAGVAGRAALGAVATGARAAGSAMLSGAANAVGGVARIASAIGPAAMTVGRGIAGGVGRGGQAAGRAMMLAGPSNESDNLPAVREPDPQVLEGEYIPAERERDQRNTLPVRAGEQGGAVAVRDQQSGPEVLMGSLATIGSNTGQTSQGIQRLSSNFDDMMDVLEKIDDNTLRTAQTTERIAGSMEQMLDTQEDKPLEGPSDDPTDPNDKTGAGAGAKKGEGLFGGVMKTIKKFFNKITLFFVAAGLVVATIMSGGAGDLFEKLKDAFSRLVEALAPVLEVIIEKVMPPLFDLFGVLVDLFTKLVEVLAPIFKTIIETVLPPVLEMFGLLAQVFTNLIEMLAPVLTVIGEVLAAVLVAVVEVINSVLRFFTDPIGYLKDGLSYLADGGDMILAGLGDFINGIIEFIADLASNIPLVGDDAAAALRDMKVEFGDNARARMATRADERAQRQAARDGVNVSPEDQAALDQSQQQTSAAAAQRVETNAGPVLPTAQEDATKVNSRNDILKIIANKDPQVKDGVVTVVQGSGRMKRRTPLKASDLSSYGYTEEEVIAAMTSAGATAQDGLFVSGSADLQSAIQDNLSVDASQVDDATVQTTSATESASAASGGGANVVAPMNNTNVQNINSSTSTGVIYTGERDSLGGRTRILPGVA